MAETMVIKSIEPLGCLTSLKYL